MPSVLLCAEEYFEVVWFIHQFSLHIKSTKLLTWNFFIQYLTLGYGNTNDQIRLK